MPANIPPGILELIVRLYGRELPQWARWRNTRMSGGGISKVLRRAIPKPHGHRLSMTTPSKYRSLIQIMKRNNFISSSRIRAELIRQTGHLVSAYTVQRRLVAAGYRSTTPSQMPQSDSWSSSPTLRMGTQTPVLEPSALVSCDICWWVHVRPLPMWWSCPSSLVCWWETGGLLHPSNGWKCRPLSHGMGCFPCIRQIGAGGDDTVNQQCYIGILGQNFLPWARAIFQYNLCLYITMPYPILHEIHAIF